MNRPTKYILPLSIVILLLTLLATLGGLFLSNIYQDNATVIQIWQSNDLVTLVVAVPLLLGAILVWQKTRTLKALLVWLGILGYLCYNYAYYVYGAAFNSLYLVYVFIYILSIGGLILGLVQFPIHELNQAIKPKFLRKTIIGEMLFIAGGLSAVYIMQSLIFVINGTLPAIIALSGNVTSVVFGIDFSMVVLFFVLGAILLAKKNPWGYVIAFIGNLKGFIYMGVLVLASLRTNPSEAPLWAVLGFLSLASFILLWIGLTRKKVSTGEEDSHRSK